MGSPERRRRNAIVAVMVLASWALVATSPATPPTQQVQATDSVGLRLTADAPAALVTLVLNASDESLWSDDEEIVPRSAALALVARVPPPSVNKTSPIPSTIPAPVLGVRLMRDGTEVGMQPNRGAVAPSVVEFDLRTACAEGRDCELELQAFVEWLNPQAGESLAAELLVTAVASIEGPEQVPVGAEMSLSVADPETAEVTVLRDTASATQVRLDADRPMVTWFVDVSANREATAEPLQWPIDPRAVLSLDIGVPEVAADDHRFGDPAMRLIIISGDEETELRPVAGSLQHQLPVFRCNAVDAPCDERLTLVAMWDGEAPEEAVIIGWELAAGITFHAPAEPVEGAAVLVGEPSRTDIHRDGPFVAATVDGSISLVDEDDPVRARTVRIDIPARGLEADRTGGPVPAVLAIVTASSTSSQPIPDDTLVRLQAGGGEELVPLPSQPPTSWVVWATPDCRADGPCRADFGLFGSAYRRDGGGLEGSELTVHWAVEVILVYPRGSPPPAGLEIDLTVGRP